MYNFHLQALNTFQGLPLFVNDNCLEKTDEPVRVHKLKRWHLYKIFNKTKLPYHDRVQKKWNKRFGFIMRPTVYISQTGIHCHPSLYDKFKEEFKNA